MKQSKIYKSKLKGKTRILNERGITLVALVVTIIILLILAGVALSLALGENGLFVMSRNATGKYKTAQINETSEMDRASNEIANITELVEGPKPIEASEIATNPKKYYGSYVNYGIDLDGNSKTSDWRLFYVGGSDASDSTDVKGRIYLIAADYVPMDNEILKIAIGEKKANMTQAYESYNCNILSAYWDWDSEYQDLTKLDPDPTILFMHTGYKLEKYKDEGEYNVIAASTLLNTDNWSGFANKGNHGDVAIGVPTIEMWRKSWNQVVDESDGFRKSYSLGTNSHGYYLGSGNNNTSWYITKTDTKLNSEEQAIINQKYNLFFPHTTDRDIEANGKTGSCNGYWLASPSAQSRWDLIHVDSEGWLYGQGTDSQYGCGLRPLVCLETGCKLQKNTTKSDETKTVYDIVK